jgi:protein involved in polysaccharide export with SLBB domain
LHELAHLKRRDVLVNWVATLLTVLHWPNPVAWLVAWRLRLERELATDELVMSRTATDADRRAYGHTIVKLLENFARGATAAPARRIVPAGGVGILEGKQQMKRRITMIARFANRNRAWTVVAASLVVGLGLVALTDAAQQPAGQAERGAKAEQAARAKPTEREPAKAEPDIPGAEGQAKDYVVGPNDLLQVTVYDIEGPGLQTIKTIRVSGTGNITLPFLKDPIRVAGLTELDAQRTIVETYEQQGVLKNANVSVAVAEARNLPKPKPEIAPDELVTVSVMDLTGAGVETVKTARVDAEGKISLPYVGRIKAAGLSSADFEQAVAKAYEEKKVLHNALVAVSLPGRGESHRLSNKTDPPAGGRAGGMPPGAMPGTPGMEAADAMGMMGGFAPADPFGGAPVDPGMVAMLDRKLPEVTFDGVPLTDVVDFLRDVTGANIFVDWRALEAAGIDRKALVAARLKDVAFKDALAVVLRGVSHDLRYTIQNGMIQIGTAPAAAKPAQLSVSAYDVGDLVAAAADPKEGAQALANVISQTVRPEFWRGGGGGDLFGGAGGAPVAGRGTISAFGNKVVVMATPEVHREIEALLAVLRQPGATQPAPTTKPEKKAEGPIRAEDLTAQDIALIDQQMANHLQMKQEIELRMEQLKLSGAGENSPALKPAMDLLKIRDQLIEDRAQWFRQKNKGLNFPNERHRLGEREHATSR